MNQGAGNVIIISGGLLRSDPGAPKRVKRLQQATDHLRARIRDVTDISNTGTDPRKLPEGVEGLYELGCSLMNFMSCVVQNARVGQVLFYVEPMRPHPGIKHAWAVMDAPEEKGGTPDGTG